MLIFVFLFSTFSILPFLPDPTTTLRDSCFPEGSKHTKGRAAVGRACGWVGYWEEVFLLALGFL